MDSKEEKNEVSCITSFPSMIFFPIQITFQVVPLQDPPPPPSHSLKFCSWLCDFYSLPLFFWTVYYEQAFTYKIRSPEARATHLNMALAKTRLLKVSVGFLDRQEGNLYDLVFSSLYRREKKEVCVGDTGTRRGQEEKSKEKDA